MNHSLRVVVGAFLVLFGLNAVAKDHIVLFKETEIAVTNLEHGEYQNLLVNANQKSVKDLTSWLGSRNIAKPVRDLWIVRGAKVDLTDEQAQKLKGEAWVQSIHEDKWIRFVTPVADLKVKNKLKEDGAGANAGLWGLSRIGLDKIRAEFPKLNGQNIRVGIIDTGIEANHAEFLTWRGNNTHLFKDFVNGITSPYDDAGHGTHVAGTISGANVGIAPGVSLTVAKAFTADGYGFESTLVEAMQWMYNCGGATKDYPQVVSNSWGGAAIANGAVFDIEGVAMYRRALQAWIAGGIIPVFAAGNEGEYQTYYGQYGYTISSTPGGLPEALSVGAIGSDDTVTYFSTRGPNLWKIGSMVVSLFKPDLSAPGLAITSSYIGGKYATWSGTSMATPHVTGTVALLLQANPKLTYAKLKEVLMNSVDKKIDTGYGYGILNAYKAVKLALARN